MADVYRLNSLKENMRFYRWQRESTFYPDVLQCQEHPYSLSVPLIRGGNVKE
jgi:hypothetical protein